MIYFAYHPKTRPTGRKMAEALGVVNRGTLRLRNSRAVQKPDFLIRWGTVRYPEFDNDKTLNSVKAICRASNKLAAFGLFEVLGGPCTPWHSSSCKGEGIVFGRSRRGFGGRDIQICRHDPCIHSEFYSEYIPNRREYRIHVVGDRVVRVQRKYLEYPELQQNEYIRNVANGYVFKTPRKRLNKDRERAAIEAVRSLGLDFGAVDLVIGSENNIPYVLEVNSAPACSPKTIQAYAQAIAQVIEERSGGDYILYPNVPIEIQLEDDE